MEDIQVEPCGTTLQIFVISWAEFGHCCDHSTLFPASSFLSVTIWLEAHAAAHVEDKSLFPPYNPVRTEIYPRSVIYSIARQKIEC